MSKAAMRSSRDVVRDSRLKTRDVDELAKVSKAQRRGTQQRIAEECFAEVHVALRSMRDELESEKREAEEEVRRTFRIDRDEMIEEMKEAVKREKKEHVQRIVSELDDSQRQALEHQRARLNDELRTEMDDGSVVQN